MSKVQRTRSLLLAMAFAITPLASAVAQTAPAPAQAPAATPAAPAPGQAAAAAQTIGGSFGVFSKNSGEPIDIESDVLVVHDQQKYATFKGNVKAVQGTTTLRATELDVHYAGSGADSLTGPAAPNASAPAASQVASADPKPAGGVALGEGGNQITQIEARGNVIITSDQDQTTTSDWALYDVPAQQVTVGGNVVLTQGKNVLKGDRLVIDLKTGESRFENTGNAATGGKIRALFMPKQEAKNGKSGDGQSGKPTASTGTPPAEPASEPAEAEPAEGGANAAHTAPEPLFPGLPQ